MVADDLGVPKLGRVVVFEVGKLFQESGYLGDDAEQVIGSGVVVHLESFDGLVVLDHRVEGFLLQLLPVLAQVIFSVRVEQKQEILDIRNYLFELEVVPGSVQMVGLLLQLAD